ncbi:MAG: hypothetical protein KF712_03215 [Akkermansiaceae bacterium]|nr:hypothetical protein [Akkermansiaceae bacterium]
MSILPKGTQGFLIGRSLPKYEPDFRPSWLWTSRGGRTIVATGKMLFPFWPTASNHIVCGNTRVGKSTLIYEGLTELAGAGIYNPGDLLQLSKPLKTENPSRFTLEREGLIENVDSWIDIKGEDFTESFSPGPQAEKRNPLFEAFLKQVNSIVMIVSAQQLIDVYRRRDKPTKGDSNLISGFVQRINNLHPTAVRSFTRKGYRWYLVVNQCADVLGNGTNKHGELVKAIRHFSDRTGFHTVTRTAILCDCKPADAASSGIKLARILVGPRGGIYLTRGGKPKVCSAGVILGIILGRIRFRANDQQFIIPLKAS